MYKIDHKVARFAAIMNAAIPFSRDGRIRWDKEFHCYVTEDEGVLKKMRSLGAKITEA